MRYKPFSQNPFVRQKCETIHHNYILDISINMCEKQKRDITRASEHQVINGEKL